MTYTSPTNAEEYWQIVYAYWEDLNHILNLYLPTFQHKDIDGSALPKTLGEHIQELKDTKHPRLVRIFNAAWWNCPEEAAGEWNHKGWNVLCDLCSEEYVIYEPKEKEYD